MRARDGAIRAIEAAYAPLGSSRTWLRGICAELEAIHPGPWFGYTIEGAKISDFVGRFPLATTRIEAVRDRVPELLLRAAHVPSPPVDTARSRWSRVARRFGLSLSEVEELHGYRIPEVTAVVACDPSGTGAFFSLSAEVSLPPRTKHTLSLVSAHVASAYRLRRFLAARARPADAVCTPDGKMLDGRRRAVAARHSIAEAVRRVDTARGKLRRLDPERAIAIWTAMVEGEWTLVDHVERDGKRLVLVHRNAFTNVAASLRGLDGEIMTLAALGHSDKFIGYELGIPRSTVASRVSKVVRRLGLKNRRELVRVFGPFVRRDEPARPGRRAGGGS